MLECVKCGAKNSPSVLLGPYDLGFSCQSCGCNQLYIGSGAVNSVRWLLNLSNFIIWCFVLIVVGGSEVVFAVVCILAAVSMMFINYFTYIYVSKRYSVRDKESFVVNRKRAKVK